MISPFCEKEKINLSEYNILKTMNVYIIFQFLHRFLCWHFISWVWFPNDCGVFITKHCAPFLMKCPILSLETTQCLAVTVTVRLRKIMLCCPSWMLLYIYFIMNPCINWNFHSANIPSLKKTVSSWAQPKQTGKVILLLTGTI